MVRSIRDANLSKTKALPAGAASTTSDPIDLESTSRADFLAGAELLIEAPALLTAQLPDTKTITYVIQHDTDAAFGSAVDLYPSILVQTGAGGGGAAAAKKRIGLPSDVKRYVRLKATGLATVDGSASSATLSLVF